MEIFSPKELTEQTVFTLTKNLWGSKNKECHLDISKLRYARPFGALVLAIELAHINKDNPVTLKGYNGARNAHSYLGHVGFFKAARYNLGKEPDEAKGSNTYIPFRKLSGEYFLKLQSSDDDDYGISRPIQYYIEREAEKMSTIITLKPDEITSISYCFREVIRNVFEHSGAQECFIFGQKWDDGIVEIVIADKGQGVLRSLQEKFKIESDSEALKMCIEPGISGKDTELKEEWSNSGFGLYVLSEIGKRYGQFILCSGQQGIVCVNGECRTFNCYFNGTVLQLKLRLNAIENIKTVIDDIIHEGECLAEKSGRVVKASQKSRIIW